VTPDAQRLARKRTLVAGSGVVADAIVRTFQREGARVVVRDNDVSALASDSEARACVKSAVAQLGGLDVVVTAFATRHDAAFLDISDEDWTRTLHGNLKSAFMIGREGALSMTAAGGGTVVHVGSDVAARPTAGTAAYAAAKAGVHLLATVMGLDLAPDGVRVCFVAAAETGTTPAPWHDAAAAAVAFCASDAASYVLGSTLFLGRPAARPWMSRTTCRPSGEQRHQAEDAVRTATRPRRVVDDIANYGNGYPHPAADGRGSWRARASRAAMPTHSDSKERPVRQRSPGSRLNVGKLPSGSST
jgi:NAD(P)-dependent dehydrogenase (short-subunit alcohol dehydrogenase family)